MDSVNPDGTLESTDTFNPGTGANDIVQSVALQADGKILIGGYFTTLNGQPHNYFGRLNPDGTVESTSTFNQGTGPNNYVDGVAVQADGKILIGGQFTSVNGQPRNYLVRLINDPAAQILTIPNRTQVRWTRGGSAPEVEQVTFEVSTNGGASWSPLGPGARIEGGWERVGLSLAGTGLIRARGRTAGGHVNGSSGLVEAIAAFTLPATVALSDLTQTYDGTAKRVTATTVPPGLTVDFTYNGSPTAPINAGSYTVIGTINDSNHQGSATNTLTIGKAAATLTLGGLLQACDGTTKRVAATTTPPGLTVDLTYDGSPDAPGTPGSYTVVGTIKDANHQGGVTNTLVVLGTTTATPLGDQTVGVGGAATFRTNPGGPGPFGFVWRKAGALIVSADGDRISIAPVTLSDAGSYTVEVTSTCGSVTNSAVLTVLPVNDAPTLAPVADVTLAEDAPAKLVDLFGITTGAADEVQKLTVTAASSDPSLIPNPKVSYTSPSATGTLTFQPVANANGTATVTVTVKDDGGTANGGQDTFTRQFTVTVTQVNDAPTLAPIADITMNEDDPARTINLTGITAGAANEIQALTLTPTSDKPELIPNPTVTYASPSATGTLSFQPLANASGTATITVTVKDDGGTANGGLDTVTRQFTVTVVPVNRLGQTITFGALEDKFVDDAPFVVSATSSSGLPVSFRVVSGPATIIDRSTLILRSTGMVTVQAFQEGDAKYNAATSVEQSFAVRASGTVVAWGSNTSGQTTVPAGLSGVTAIAGGLTHTVALKRDGTVVAWGLNRYGQTDVPAGLSGVTAIAAGVNHTVALKRDGTVVAWGYNGTDQTTVPAGLTSVTAIAAGSYHTVALKRDGTVVAWGAKNVDYGQTKIPAGLSGVTAIAAGNFHTVALKGDGTVVAWGANSFSQTDVPPGLSGVVNIAAGSEHTVALKRDGTVVAWGRHDVGQTTVPASLSEVTAIAAGQNHTVALKREGTAVAWGDNGNGQTTVPVGLSGVLAIAAGQNHTMALIPSVTSVIGDVHRLVNGAFSFRSYSEPNQTVIIESSTNLNLWTPILTNKINASGYLEFTEPVDPLLALKYYRVRLP